MVDEKPSEEPEVIRNNSVWGDLTVDSENGKEEMGQTEFMMGNNRENTIRRKKKIFFNFIM